MKLRAQGEKVRKGERTQGERVGVRERGAGFSIATTLRLQTSDFSYTELRSALTDLRY